MIKTTLVGHACLLIQSKETTILTDPVWFDYLWEEINVLCPSVVLEKDKVRLSMSLIFPIGIKINLIYVLWPTL